MSNITDVILITAVDDQGSGVTRLQLWLAEEAHEPLARVDGHAAGRAMQSDVYAGAYNYLAAERIAAAFRLCNWESPEEALLLLKGEHDDWFEVYRDDQGIVLEPGRFSG